MKKKGAIFIVVVIFSALQCNSKAELRIDNVHQKEKSYNDHQASIPNVNFFPDYVFKTKDTICKSWDHGGKSVFTNLGNCKIKNRDFRVLTEFRLIPVADGLRGKSILYLVSKGNDTLTFDAIMPEELPMDLYRNNFIFINNEKQYLFGEIDQLHEEIICFNTPDGKCFTK